MKTKILLFVTLFGLVLTQDVRIPENLLEVTTKPLNSTDVEHVETAAESGEVPSNETSIDSPAEAIPDYLIAAPQPNIVRPYYPTYTGSYPIYHQQSPCAVVQPPGSYPIYQQQSPCAVVPTLQTNYYPEPIQPLPQPLPQPIPIYPARPIHETERPTTIPIQPTVDTRFDPIEREEILSCPFDYVQNGTHCVELYSRDCPEGYIWKDEHCVLSRIICPLNFELQGGTCVQRPICPSNHILNNGRCVQPQPECPSGWTWNGDTCAVINIQCHHGSVLRGHECVIESIACPDGFNRVGDECFKPDPFCPPGSELRSSGFCVRVNQRCPSGSVLVNGECRRTVVSCPPGSYKDGDQCYRLVNTTQPSIPRPPERPPATIVDPTRRPHHKVICPESYKLYNNLCYRCPPPYHFCENRCQKTECNQTAPRPLPSYPSPSYPLPSYPSPSYPLPSYPTPIYPPTSPSNCPPVSCPPHRPYQQPYYPFSSTPNCPQISCPLPSPHPMPSTGYRPSSQGFNILNNVEPVINTIHNVNNVTHPITLNNLNTNNIFIYTDTQCSDGSIRTVIVKNNETINGCVDVIGNRTAENESGHLHEGDDEREDKSKCCEVVTPRQCKQRTEDSWQCTHKRYSYCGRFCIADRLYLKPRETSYQNNVLTIPPSHHHTASPCFGRNCPAFGS